MRKSRLYCVWRVCVRAATAVALAAALALAASASARGASAVTIESPQNGLMTNSQTIDFRGESEEFKGSNPVVVFIYAAGKQLEEIMAAQNEEGTSWSAQSKSLAPGTYTAQAAQLEHRGEEPTPSSNVVTFTIDTTPPQVSITYPANGSASSGESQLLTGQAGTAPGDLSSVRVELFAGPSATPPAVAILEPAAVGISWSAPFGGLRPGTYTALATQRDQAGNVGVSAPVTFELTAPPPPPPPSASFTWFPLSPVVGQNVVLVSSSTDAASPLRSFAWDLAGNGPFKVSGPVLTTSFSTPGNHVVRLQVGDARGASSVATETIHVSSRPLSAMQPFPIVRIAGVQTANGVRLSLLSVQAPVGTRVSVACKGRACRMKPLSRVATASSHNRKASVVVLSFPRFERSFPAGVVLQVRVSAAGEMGKYTSFSIHRYSLPTRVDECLAALNPQPIRCPA